MPTPTSMPTIDLICERRKGYDTYPIQYGNREKGDLACGNCHLEAIEGSVYAVTSAMFLIVAMLYFAHIRNKLRDKTDVEKNWAGVALTVGTLLSVVGTVLLSSSVYGSMYDSIKDDEKETASHGNVGCVSNTIQYNECLEAESTCAANMAIYVTAVSVFSLTTPLTHMLSLLILKYIQNPAAFMEDMSKLRTSVSNFLQRRGAHGPLNNQLLPTSPTQEGANVELVVAGNPQASI